MKYSIHIPYKFPSLNEYTNACRSNRYAGAKMKKEAEEVVMWHAIGLPVIDKKVKLHFHWIEKNKKRDLDNVAFAKKFIQDALVKKGILANGDGWKSIIGFTDTFSVDKDKPRVVVVIEEMEN